MPHGSHYLHEVPGAVQEKMKRQQRTLDFLDWIGLVTCCSFNHGEGSENLYRIRSISEGKQKVLTCWSMVRRIIKMGSYY